MANTRDGAAVWQSVKDKTANLMVWIERVTATATKIMERAAEAERFLEQHQVLFFQLRVQVQEMAASHFFWKLRRRIVMAVRSLQEKVMIYARGLWGWAKDEYNLTLQAMSCETRRLYKKAKEQCCAEIAALTETLQTLHFHGFKATPPVKLRAPATWSYLVRTGVSAMCAVATAPKVELDARRIIEEYGSRVAVAISVPSLVEGIAVACTYGYEMHCERGVRLDVMRMEHIAADIEALIGSLAVISEAALVDIKSDAPSQAGELPDVVRQWLTEDEMTVHVMEEIRETVKMLETFVTRPIVHAKDVGVGGVSFTVHVASMADGEESATTVALAGLSRRTPKPRCCTA
jgi:hypothetical protein